MARSSPPPHLTSSNPALTPALLGMTLSILFAVSGWWLISELARTRALQAMRVSFEEHRLPDRRIRELVEEIHPLTTLLRREAQIFPGLKSTWFMREFVPSPAADSSQPELATVRSALWELLARLESSELKKAHALLEEWRTTPPIGAALGKALGQLRAGVEEALSLAADIDVAEKGGAENSTERQSIESQYGLLRVEIAQLLGVPSEVETGIATQSYSRGLLKGLPLLAKIPNDGDQLASINRVREKNGGIPLLNGDLEFLLEGAQAQDVRTNVAKLDQQVSQLNILRVGTETLRRKSQKELSERIQLLFQEVGRMYMSGLPPEPNPFR